MVGGPTMALDTTNCLIRTPSGKLTVLKDLDNYIVVDENDVLLIYPKNKEQEIKAVTALVKKETGEMYL
jgi:mannose-1-phosphate guanylyltransferase